MTKKKPTIHEAFGFDDSDKLLTNTAPILDALAGARMKQARMFLMMSQADLGDIIGLSQSAVGDIEIRGNLRTKAVTMKTFMTAFGADLTKWILWNEGAAEWAVKMSAAYKQFWKIKNGTKGNRVPFYERDTVQALEFKKNKLMSQLEYETKRTSLANKVQDLEKQISNTKGGRKV